MALPFSAVVLAELCHTATSIPLCGHLRLKSHQVLESFIYCVCASLSFCIWTMFGKTHGNQSTVAPRPSHVGTGPIHMNSVQCTGREKSLTECTHRPVPLYSCKHSQDVAVRCNIPETGTQATVRHRQKHVHAATDGHVRMVDKPSLPEPSGASGRRQRAVRGPGGGADGDWRSEALGLGLQ